MEIKISKNRPRGLHLFGVLMFGIALIISMFFWSFDRTIILYCGFILTDLWWRTNNDKKD